MRRQLNQKKKWKVKKTTKISLNIVLSFQKIKQGGLQIDSLIKCCVSAQVRLIVGALIGGDIHFTDCQEEEEMVEITGFTRSISSDMVMTVSENLE